ncbi:hypothetical protein [Hymenobacter bucti]|uniref:Uncharacterized protein n=1 Tax=Hymenobacter bucti TaxID=1844114 RepID=A0ABW4QXP7_9BACT
MLLNVVDYSLTRVALSDMEVFVKFLQWLRSKSPEDTQSPYILWLREAEIRQELEALDDNLAYQLARSGLGLAETSEGITVPAQ